MQLDISTLLCLLLAELLSLTVMLPVLMGREVSRAARFAQGFIGMQSLGWLGLLVQVQNLAPSPGNWPFVFAMGCLSASLSSLWMALGDWLGPRPGRWFAFGAPVLISALSTGRPVSQDIYGGGWVEAGLALQMLMLVTASLWPRDQRQRQLRPSTDAVAHKDKAWRGLLGLSFLLLATLTFGRALKPLISSTPVPPLLVQAQLIAVAVVLVATVLAVLVAWRGETEQLLQRQAQTDALTGLTNRRAFGGRAVEMIAMARRYQEPLSLVMLDLDHFKLVNDQHGHEAGDRALLLFADCVQRALRLGDLAGRVGGEEFCVLLARSGPEGPKAMDRRLREELQRRALPELGFALDFSAGWALLRHGDRSVEDLMRRADAALYEAKRSGRGRLSDEPGATEPASQELAPETPMV